MEELMMFDKNEQRLMDAGLIAVSLVILQVWVSSGIHDTASLISLIAFSVSLPMIALDLMFNHTSLIFSKIDWYLDDSSSKEYEPPFKPVKTKKVDRLLSLNQMIGMLAAVIGIILAIWHASWIAGLIFLIISIASFIIYTEISPSREELLRVTFALGYKEGKDLQEEIDELKRKNEEEYLKDFYYFD